jgi:mannose-6-phosphate isomerase-like protein (cupin superfamily)
VDEHGVRSDDAEITPFPGSALVRVLTIAPVALADWAPNLHGDNDRHVLLLVSGTVDLILEDTEVPMSIGDSVVLSGHVHDWRNTSGEPAVLVYTTFTLTAS